MKKCMWLGLVLTVVMACALILPAAALADETPQGRDEQVAPTTTNTKVNTLRYGEKSLTGVTVPGARVTVKLGGKTKKVMAGENGSFTIKGLPRVKIGSKLKFSSSTSSGKYTKVLKVKKSKTSIKLNRVYKSSTKVKMTLKNVHKGNLVTLKVGTSTYQRKINKDAEVKKLKIKVSKHPAGTKVRLKVMNKFKQKLASKKAKVYFSSDIHDAHWKKDVMLVPGYSSPDVVKSYGQFSRWIYYDTPDYQEVWLDFNPDGYVGASQFWWYGEE